MENFIVSARKYRPQTFDTVVGQKSITSTLKNAIRNNQLAQAFLFCGPRGVGKTTCARILAKTINCADLSDGIEACDKCPSCISFNENASFNIYELDGASNNSVDDIRNLVDQVRIPPQMGKYKVYIIDEVHMLSQQAFNAFLKTLEEPPAYTKFILATTEKHRIIPTILSRCQIFDFKRITVDDIVDHLQHVAGMENVAAEEDALHIIAQKADGAMRDALTIFDQLVSFTGNSLTYDTVLENLNVLDYEYFFRITDQILQGDLTNTLLTINDIIGKGFDGQHFLTGFAEHLRNLLVCKDPATAVLLETAPSIRNHYVEQSARCHASRLLTMLDMVTKCDLNYKISNNKRLHVELAVMQMCGPVPDPIPGPSPKKEPPPTPDPSPNGEGSIGQGKPTGAVRMKDLREGFTSATSVKRPPTSGITPVPAGEDDEKNNIAAPFTRDALVQCWNEFADTLRKGSPHLHATLKNSAPELRDDWEIGLTLDNKVLEEELNLRKTEMTEFLRTRLNNFRIRLVTRVAETPQNLRPYTDKEKYEMMAGKNPALRNLREELDLEIEY